MVSQVLCVKFFRVGYGNIMRKLPWKMDRRIVARVMEFESFYSLFFAEKYVQVKCYRLVQFLTFEIL